eukprot:6207517-Pleurochrysis_carterae.AAC.7
MSTRGPPLPASSRSLRRCSVARGCRRRRRSSILTGGCVYHECCGRYPSVLLLWRAASVMVRVGGRSRWLHF